MHSFDEDSSTLTELLAISNSFPRPNGHIEHHCDGEPPAVTAQWHHWKQRTTREGWLDDRSEQSVYRSGSSLHPSLRQEVALDGLEALRQAVKQAEAKGVRLGSLRQREFFQSQPAERIPIHAEPLSPLRARDLEAMQALFQVENMGEIEIDITQMLLRLWPEPCWEDSPLDFLQDFLI
ncbi:hypothetical protein [Pantanalinema sp. GBBB05]|uniref:hypothetical protein n=1 Tax=Pantanalinema sp. GBBB05 TaxID=2604139 RepID=UPI003D8163F2